MDDIKQNTLFNEYSSLILIILLLFAAPCMIRDLSSKNAGLKPKGEHRIDSINSIIPECELPAIMRGYEDDSVHTTIFSAPGRKIAVTVFKKDFKNKEQLFLGDTSCRDSLSYSCDIYKLQNNECIRLVSSLFDCKDSLLSKKVIIFYNKNFIYSNFY